MGRTNETLHHFTVEPSNFENIPPSRQSVDLYLPADFWVDDSIVGTFLVMEIIHTLGFIEAREDLLHIPVSMEQHSEDPP